MKEYLKLFISFFKVGLFTFGGGYAMLPLIEKEIVDTRDWIDKEELLEIASIAQMTPGAIATNSATFVGSKILGIPGALIATFGVVLPSFIIVTIIFNFFGESFENEIIKKMFLGIKTCVIAFILNSALRLMKANMRKSLSFFIFSISIILLLFGINPVNIIITFGILGVLLYKVNPNYMKLFI